MHQTLAREGPDCRLLHARSGAERKSWALSAGLSGHLGSARAIPTFLSSRPMGAWAGSKHLWVAFLLAWPLLGTHEP